MNNVDNSPSNIFIAKISGRISTCQLEQNNPTIFWHFDIVCERMKQYNNKSAIDFFSQLSSKFAFVLEIINLAFEFRHLSFLIISELTQMRGYINFCYYFIPGSTHLTLINQKSKFCNTFQHVIILRPINNKNYINK